MTKLICKGTLNAVNENTMIDGYSKKHLKDFYGSRTVPYVAGDLKDFNKMVTAHSDGASISGVQRKMFMRISKGVIVPCNQGEYIIKPAPTDFAHLPENEQAIMLLAKSVGFKVAECSVLPFESGELAYITKRFDIIGPSTKLLIEDGASICQIAPVNKGSDALSYEKYVKEMIAACGGAHAITFVLFRMVLFSYLVGNNDLHLKNFSFFRHAHTRRTTMDGVTPLYDVLSVAPYPEYDNCYLSLSLLESETDAQFSSSYDAYGCYTYHDFLLFGQSIGLNAGVTEKVINKLKTDVLKHLSLIERSNLPGDIRDIILGRINERCKCLDMAII